MSSQIVHGIRTKSSCIVLGLGWLCLVTGPVFAQNPGDEEVLPPPVEGVPEGWKIVEGDILVPDDGSDGEPRDPSGPAQWPNGVVYFEFDSNVSAVSRSIAMNAMDEWIGSDADVAFVPRTNEPNYLYVQNHETSTFTPAGMVTGVQYLSVSFWTQPVLVHELGHTLGLYHEQTRPDRDAYIDIIEENVIENQTDQFTLQSHWMPGTLNTGYDFGSIMHYPECAFAKDCGFFDCPSCPDAPHGGRTIVVLPPNGVWQGLIGLALVSTSIDRADIAAAYGTGVDIYVDNTRPVSTNVGALSNPYDSLDFGIQQAAGGEVWIKGSDYELEDTTFSEPVTLHAYQGIVTITVP